MDVSADLGELSRCPVGLVSSGVKSILDIRRSVLFHPVRLTLTFFHHRTLEYLVRYRFALRVKKLTPVFQETLGVPVVTYGKTREFPAFFTRHSGVDVRLDNFACTFHFIDIFPGPMECE